jgi:hypothetical protein
MEMRERDEWSEIRVKGGRGGRERELEQSKAPPQDLA